MENGIMQVTYILNGPMDNLLLYCHIILYWQRVTSNEKFSNSLYFEVCLENFNVSVPLLEVSKCWNMIEFPKVSIKMKNFKTSYEAQTASRLKEIIKTTRLKPLTFPEDIQKYADICLPSALKMQFLGF